MHFFVKFISTAAPERMKYSFRMVVRNFNPHERFVEVNDHIRLSLVHATTIFGREAWSGRNRIPWHRVFVIAETAGGIGGEVRDHSLKTKNLFPLKKGKMYFLPGGHDYEFVFNRGMRLLGFHFSLELFSGCDLLGHRTRPSEWELSAAELTVFDKALGHIKTVGDMVRLRGLLLTALGRLVDLKLEKTLSLFAARRKYKKVLDFLEKNGRAEMPVAEFARIAGVSAETFSREFSRDLGVPFKTFLTRSLFARASEALFGTDRKIREISHDLGFSSEFYFSRFIKKNSGLPPKEYRALARSKAGKKSVIYG